MAISNARGTRRFVLTGSAVVLGLLASAARAGDSRDQLSGFWGDFGLGVGHLDASSGPNADKGEGAWVDMVIGGRLNDQWLLGFNLAGVGIKPSSSYSDTYGSNVYGEFVTNIFIDVRYEPGAYSGWFFGFGGGRVVYHNRDLEATTGSVRSGLGTAAIARLGYDWRVGRRTHVEAQLSVEAGNVSLGAPLAGSFGFSTVALGVHIAHH